jgi:hypothetical protein
MLANWPTRAGRLLRDVASALALATPTDDRLRSIYDTALPIRYRTAHGSVRATRPRLPAPGAFEQRFARLHREGRYLEMWPLLADDAQRVWGGPDTFAERMRSQAAGVELLDADVEDVDVLPEWTDVRRGRSYRNVARLGVRYRVKHGPRQWALRRQVHLVPAADGWRTLWYPQPE